MEKSKLGGADIKSVASKKCSQLVLPIPPNSMIFDESLPPLDLFHNLLK